MGQNPNRTPSEHPIQSNHYIEPKMGGEFTNPHKNRGSTRINHNGQMTTASHEYRKKSRLPAARWRPPAVASSRLGGSARVAASPPGVKQESIPMAPHGFNFSTPWFQSVAFFFVLLYEARPKLLTYGRFATYFESPLSFSSMSMVFQGYRFFESPLSLTKRRILNSTEVILTVLHIYIYIYISIYICI